MQVITPLCEKFAVGIEDNKRIGYPGSCDTLCGEVRVNLQPL